MAMAMSAASLATLLITTTLAQNSPEDYVSLHNAARAAAGVGLVAWDDAVARDAAKRAEGCGARLRSSHGGDGGRGRHGYGENLFRGPPENAWTAGDAVRAWTAGDAVRAWTAPMAKEYVQVVWPGSTKIGCARAVCDGNRGIFISCSYEPAVNENMRSVVLPAICRYNISRCFNCTIC